MTMGGVVLRFQGVSSGGCKLRGHWGGYALFLYLTEIFSGAFYDNIC